MMTRRTLLSWLLAGWAGVGCSASRPASSSSGLPTQIVQLPNGARITVELAMTPREQTRGMMFRDELAPERGMLFLFPEAGRRPFWMFQTRIPLDIIWMDENRRIVEIAANVPPCEDRTGRDCPNYGGSVPSRFVLELAAGQAAGHGLRPGDQLRF